MGVDGAEEADWAGAMRTAISGDTAAYAALLKRIAARLRPFVRSGLTRSGLGTADAEDVVQDVLLAIHAKRHTWREDEPLEPWVWAIARHKLIDAIRRRGRRAEVDIDPFVETLAEEPAENGPSSREVERALATLPKGQRAVVSAISLDGFSIRETSSKLGMTEGAVRVALHRGLESLARTFGRA